MEPLKVWCLVWLRVFSRLRLYSSPQHRDGLWVRQFVQAVMQRPPVQNAQLSHQEAERERLYSSVPPTASGVTSPSSTASCVPNAEDMMAFSISVI